jgi:hypothetical protein
VLASYDHIVYKKGNLSSFFKFWEEVTVYEQKERTTLPVTAMIDVAVRERLISTDRRNLDNGQFFQLTHEQLYNLMQMEFRPKDRLDFMKQLENNVDFEISSHYRPTPEYFKPFYDALLLYMSKFSKVYDILVLGIRDDKTILPRCDNKTGGLVKAFVSKIPYEYGTNVLLLLSENKWETLGSFLKVFGAIVDGHKQDAESARKLRRTFSGTQYESKKFDQKLQHLQELRAYQEDSNLADEDLQAAVAAAAEELEEELDTMIAAAMQPQRKDAPRKPFPDKNAPPRDPLVCITKLLFGTCNKSQCNYSHKEELVTKKRHEFLDLIQKQLAASRNSPRGYPPQKVAAIEDTYDDEEDY